MKRMFYAFFGILFAACLSGRLQGNELTAEQKVSLKEGLKNDNAVFIRNMGQWDKQVLFLAKRNGMNTWVTRDGIVFEHYKPVTKDGAGKTEEREMVVQAVKMTFSGASAVSVTPGLKKSGYFNYMISPDKARWVSNVPLYKEVTLNEVYKGVSVRLYFEGEKIRYDIIAEPYADLSRFEMTFQGAEDVFVNDKNQLAVKTQLGDVLHEELTAFQETGAAKDLVGCKFIMSGKNSVKFDVSGYDHSRRLVIDPLLFATYLGGTYDDFIYDVTTDSDYRPIVYGMTTSGNFPTTYGVYRTAYPGSLCSFVTKFNYQGTGLIFSTFIGEVKYSKDNAAIAVDSDNNIYIADIIDAGTSADPYIVPAYVTPIHYIVSTLPNDLSDGVFWLLNSLGTQLLYTTLIASPTTDELTSIDVDANQNVYIGGYNKSSVLTNLPPTTNAYSVTPLGNKECFIVKLVPANTDKSEFTRDYVTFFGGPSNESLTSLKVVAEDMVCFCGTTTTDSASFPLVNYYRNRASVSCNGYIAAISTLGNNTDDLEFSSFIGGGNSDNPRALCTVNGNTAYLTGYTMGGNDFPVTNGAYDETWNGGFDGFLQVVSISGPPNPIYSTYVGGSGNEYLTDVDVDKLCYNVAVTGSTTSSNYPTTGGAYRNYITNGTDGVLTKLRTESNNVLDLVYSTYLGASNCEPYHNSLKCSRHVIDTLYGISLEGDIYIAGSVAGPITPTANVFDVTQEFNEGFLMDFNVFPECSQGSDYCNYNISMTYDSLCCNTITITNINTTFIKYIEIANSRGEVTTYYLTSDTLITQLCANNSTEEYTMFWITFYGSPGAFLCYDVVHFSCGCCGHENLGADIVQLSSNHDTCCVEVIGWANQSTVEGLCDITRWGIGQWDPVSNTFESLYENGSFNSYGRFTYNPPCMDSCGLHRYEIRYYDGEYDSNTIPRCKKVVEYRCDSCWMHDFSANLTKLGDCCFKLTADSDPSACVKSLKFEKLAENGYTTLSTIDPYPGGPVSYSGNPICDYTSGKSVYRVSLWNRDGDIVCYKKLEWTCTCCDLFEVSLVDTVPCDPRFIYGPGCPAQPISCYYRLNLNFKDQFSMTCTFDSVEVLINGIKVGTMYLVWLPELDGMCFLQYNCDCNSMGGQFFVTLRFWKGNNYCEKTFGSACDCVHGPRISPDNAEPQPSIDNSGMIKIMNLYNVPNPATNSTTVYFELSDKCNVTVEVYDVLGNRIELLKEGTANKGMNELLFITDKYPNGIYYVIIKACDSKGNLPVTIIK